MGRGASGSRSPSRERLHRHSSKDVKQKHKHKERERDKDRDKDRDRDRERGRDRRDRDRDGGGNSKSHKEPSRTAHKERRSVSRSRSRSPKRHRSTHNTAPVSKTSVPAPAAPTPKASATVLQPLPAPAAGKSDGGATPEVARRNAREAEAAELDAEIERRRRRVEEWRGKRAAEQTASERDTAAAQGGGTGAPPVHSHADTAEAAAGPTSAEGGVQGDGQVASGEEEEVSKGGKGKRGRQRDKGWSFEDDSEDDAVHEQDDAGKMQDEDEDMQDVQKGAEAEQEEEEEDDPLEAFMRSNQTQLVKPVKLEAVQMQEEEADSLDAFMAEAVNPKVLSLSADETQALGRPASRGPHAVSIKQEPEPATSTGVVTSGSLGFTDSKAGPMSDTQGPLSIKLEEGAPTSSEITMKSESQGLPRSQAQRGVLPVALTGKPGSVTGKRARPVAGRRRPRAYGSDSDDSDSVDEGEASKSEDDDDWAKRVTAGKMSKGDKLGMLDHSLIDYPPFRKAFYTEVPELGKMSEADVVVLRKELDGIKVRGNIVPKPIRTWTQCGLSMKILDLLRKNGCMQPLAIQAQALPIIMSGRDCIGIAKTGSGKTLAYVLPLLRHAKDQPALVPGDGPIGLIMAPTRELVQQISKEVKKFGKPLSIECTAVFGGSGISNQISELKRGSEVIVCTPGRMIDLLATSNGKITNLRRVTYLVMDEADRMFDMGFEPQIMRIINNVRPDRQTVLFSATFPRTVEALARKILDNPCEILVGGRSVVNKDITQLVEIRPDADRFLRLLEVLGEWYEEGKIIIFVQSQDKCDNLFRDLLKAGYPCLSLHGGKDQSDRECTITDFKGSVCNILVATSIAARGLDVAQMKLVVNYDCPNHHEDYVHRVGRTGRAGNKGTAITFISPEEDKYAPDLCKALRESGAPVPQDLQDLADGWMTKRRAGLVTGHSSGFGGSGFKFDSEEADKVKNARKSAAKDYGYEAQEESDSSDDDIRAVSGAVGSASAAAAAAFAAGGTPADAAAAAATAAGAAVAAAVARQQHIANGGVGPPPGAPGPVPGAAADLANMQAAINAAVSSMAAARGFSEAKVPTPAMHPNLAAALQKIQATAPAGSLWDLPAAAPAPTPAPTPAPSLWDLPAPLSQAVNPAVLMAQQVAARLGGISAPTAPMYAPAQPAVSAAVAAALAGMPGLTFSGASQIQAAGPSAPLNAIAAREAAVRAANLAAAWGTRTGAQIGAPMPALAAAAGAVPASTEQHFETELEINDFQQHARWKVTHRDTVSFVAETTGAALITKGVYVLPGKQPPEGERKLYLLIEGPTENSVKRAKQELKRVLEEATEKVMRRDAPAGGAGSMGKYSVM